MEDKRIHSDDMISMSSLKNMFLGFFRVLFDLFYFMLELVKKFIVLFIILIILGAGLGFYFYKKQQNVYEQTMIVKFNVLSKRTYYEIFDQLNSLATPNGYPVLAQELNMKESDARMILGIDLESVNGIKLDKDTSTRIDQPLVIRVLTTSQLPLDTLQNAILNKINGNSYLHRLKELRRQLALNKIDWVDRELNKLDSLKDEYTRSLNSSHISATFYNNAFNPAEVFVQSNNLINQKEELLRWLNEDYNSIALIDGFKATGIPKNISLTRAILFGILLGIALGYLITFLLEIRNKVR